MNCTAPGRHIKGNDSCFKVSVAVSTVFNCSQLCLRNLQHLLEIQIFPGCPIVTSCRNSANVRRASGIIVDFDFTYVL